MDGYRVLAGEAASGGSEDVESYDVWQVPLSLTGPQVECLVDTVIFLMWETFPQLAHGFFSGPLCNSPLALCKRKAW